MTTSVEHATWASSGDAAYQAWVQAIYDCITGSGLVQTADTGQLAVSPVVATYPGSSTYSGYWIFRFNDAAQSGAPIYIKVEPGRGNVTGSPWIKYTWGTGTDGAGTITGVVQAAVTNSASGWSPGTTTPVQFQACYHEATGCFWFSAGAATGAGSNIMINRFLDSDGTPNAEGWVGTYALAGSGEVHSLLEVGDNVVRNPAGLFTVPRQLASIQGLGSNGTFPIFPGIGWANGQVYQLGGFYGCAKGDVPHGSDWTINQFGVDINYRGVGGSSLPPYAYDMGGQNGAGVMLVWE